MGRERGQGIPGRMESVHQDRRCKKALNVKDHSVFWFTSYKVYLRKKLGNEAGKICTMEGLIMHANFNFYLIDVRHWIFFQWKYDTFVFSKETLSRCNLGRHSEENKREKLI